MPTIKTVVSQPDRDSHTPAPVIECAGFDHLVDAAKNREWEGDAERLRCLNIYEQLDFCRLLHRQVGRFVALKNASGVDAD